MNNSWALALDKWFLFVAGQIQDRAALRWLYQHRQQITAVWFWSAVVCSVFYLLFFFGAFDSGRHSSSLAFDIARISTLNAGGGFYAALAVIIGCLGLGAVTPVLLVLVPLALFLLPLFMVGLALWVVVAFLSLILAALAPFGLMIGARALFEHYAFRWLAEGSQREKERAAVYAALGLDGGASRSVFGGQGVGDIQHQAHPMTEEEAAAFEKFSKSAVLLGRAFGRPFWVDTLKHILMVAGSRGGKGRDLIVPNLKIYEGSVFVLDPKGENAQQTAKARAAFGDVFALDPFGVSGLPSVSFNPLAKMRGDSMIAEAQTLADALILEGGDPYFSSSGRQLLAGVILHVVTVPDVKEETKELTTAEDIEQNPHSKTPVKIARDLSTVRTLLMQKLPETLAEMAESDDPTAGAALRDIGKWGLSTSSSAPSEWSGIRNSAVISLEWLVSPQMAAILRDTGDAGLDFSDYLKKSMSVFVCLPAPMFETYNRWLRLVVAAALDAMTARLAPPPLPVRFVLDEVAQLGNLSKIESALSLSAGYGVQLWGVWQYIGDVERCYPKSGVSGWTSSAGVRMCFATNDNKTCDEFARQSGGVFSPDYIARLSASDMLVLLDRQNPAIIQRDALKMV